jgi:DNA-binding response OmpR family regulator
MMSNRNPVKILLVDEDQSMTESLTAMFNSDDFQLKLVTSPDQAVLSVNQEEPELFIMDISSSNGRTFSICRQIKQVSTIPILLLSSGLRSGLVEEALDAGADEVLMKPVSKNILMAYVNTLTRRARAEKAATRTD